MIFLIILLDWRPIPTEPTQRTTRPTQRPYPYPPTRPEPEPEQPSYYCDPNGAYNQQPPCQCKPNRQGPRCESCVDRHFSCAVPNKNPYCTLCFCNGQQVECEQSRSYYNKIESKFTANDDGWKVDNKHANLSTSLNLKEDGIEFVEFDEFPNEELFFYAPEKYLGNKVQLIFKF